MEEIEARIESPQPAHKWGELIRSIIILLLSAIVFICVLLYFREFTLLIKYVLFAWLALLFTLLAFFWSLFSVIQWIMRWYREQEVASRALLALVILFLIILCVVVSVIGFNLTTQIYDDRSTLFSLDSLPTYLGFKKSSMEPADVAQAIHKLVNEERTKQQLSNLSYDNVLESIAKAHSNDMTNNTYFEHINGRGEDAIARGKKAGYLCEKDYGVIGTTRTKSEGIGENLALTPLGDVQGCGSVFDADAIARCTVQGWMNSEEHRKNILTAIYDREGIGIARNKNDFYITQNFC